jgi:hypothetical protein
MGGAIEGDCAAHRARGAPLQPGNNRAAPILPAFHSSRASSFAVEVSAAPVHAKDEIEGAIAALMRKPGGGLIVMPDVFNELNRSSWPSAQ